VVVLESVVGPAAVPLSSGWRRAAAVDAHLAHSDVSAGRRQRHVLHDERHAARLLPLPRPHPVGRRRRHHHPRVPAVPSQNHRRAPGTRLPPVGWCRRRLPVEVLPVNPRARQSSVLVQTAQRALALRWRLLLRAELDARLEHVSVVRRRGLAARRRLPTTSTSVRPAVSAGAVWHGRHPRSQLRPGSMPGALVWSPARRCAVAVAATPGRRRLSTSGADVAVRASTTLDRQVWNAARDGDTLVSRRTAGTARNHTRRSVPLAFD